MTEQLEADGGRLAAETLAEDVEVGNELAVRKAG